MVNDICHFQGEGFFFESCSEFHVRVSVLERIFKLLRAASVFDGDIPRLKLCDI
jgi:hypothetical protein